MNQKNKMNKNILINTLIFIVTPHGAVPPCFWGITLVKGGTAMKIKVIKIKLIE